MQPHIYPHLVQAAMFGVAVGLCKLTYSLVRRYWDPHDKSNCPRILHVTQPHLHLRCRDFRILAIALILWVLVYIILVGIATGYSWLGDIQRYFRQPPTLSDNIGTTK